MQNNIEAQRIGQIKHIDSLLSTIQGALTWADKFHKDDFPSEAFREYRRELKKIKGAVSEKCSAAAYGESQVGKSYLMGSLMASEQKPLFIENAGRKYNFVMELNPSGGNTAKVESTGVITRFTVTPANPVMKDYVKVSLLSVADIVNVLVDGYYKDVKLTPESIFTSQDIDNRLNNIDELKSEDPNPVQTVITRDDVKNICDYIYDFLGDKCVSIVKSRFSRMVSSHIHRIPPEKWIDVFSILWNNNQEISRLFKVILSEYSKIGYNSEVYVPFRAIMWRHGTILKIDWIDVILGQEVRNDVPELETAVEVRDANNKILAAEFSKAVLSSITAEIVLVIPTELAVGDRKFLNEMDFLDFPGARSRKEFQEHEIKEVLPTILRRGKVAYLFNSYTSNLRLSSILFCFHNDQAEAPIGGPISQWIDNNIADSTQKREEFLRETQGISPLFLIATKFNCDLQYIDDKDLPGALTDHWIRFDGENGTIKKIIEPAKWYDQWTPGRAFRHVYPLRDFKWSRKQNLFDGVDSHDENSEESDYHRPTRFPDYFIELRKSFIENPQVRLHFDNPAQAWEEFATVGNDGSKPILRDLNIISQYLTNVRHNKFQNRIAEIQSEILSKMLPHYVPANDADKNKRTKEIIRKIRLRTNSTIGDHPEIFGYTINQLMIPTDLIRRIAFDIIILHTEVPAEAGKITTLKIQADITPTDTNTAIIDKLCDYLMCDESELDQVLMEEYECTIDAFTESKPMADTTVADLLAHRIIDGWSEYLNSQSKYIADYLPYTDEIVYMYQTLARKFNIKKIIADKIDTYEDLFSHADLPIAIADFASLLLNNLVSSVGIEYMKSEHLESVRTKLEACRISSIALPAVKHPREVGLQTLVSTLDALDKAEDFSNIDKDVLSLLPFWNAFTTFQNNLAIGIVLSSDVVKVDEQANNEIKKLIDTVDGKQSE